MFAHHYIAVAIAALSGLIFLHLVADKTRCDKWEVRKICFKSIQVLAGIEALGLLALVASLNIENDAIFMHIKERFGPKADVEEAIPFSVIAFVGFVSIKAIDIKVKHLSENGKFYDLLIGLCIFFLLNTMTGHLLDFTITIKHLVYHLTAGFVISLMFIALAITRRRSAMKS